MLNSILLQGFCLLALFLISCRGDTDLGQIKRIIIVQNSIADTSLNNKFVLEISQQIAKECDVKIDALISFYNQEVGFTRHPAFDSIYGCKAEFCATNTSIPLEYKPLSNGSYFVIDFTGTQPYHDFEMMRTLHEPYFRSQMKFVYMQEGRLMSFDKAADFRVETYDFDREVSNAYAY